MPDREKVIKGLECHTEHNCDGCHYYGKNQFDVSLCPTLLTDALELLKEQEDLGTELTNAVELIHKKNERIEKLLKEQEAVVRCKDCKNADYGTDEDGNRFMKCIGSVKCYGGTTPDWFCADGVAKDINVPDKEGR